MLQKSDIYKINGTPIPQPTNASPRISGFQLFGERTNDALMHKETVAYKRHIELKFDKMEQNEMSALLNMVIKDPPVEYFQFTYFDPQKGIQTITAFSNEFGQELYSAVFYGGLWRNVSFNVIER